MKVRLSLQAMTDIEDIRSVTIDQWGQDQWLRYFAALSSALQRIAADPTCGRPRDLIRDGMRSLPFQKHHIFFRPALVVGDKVAIIRIVHERRNFAALSYHDDLDPYPHS
jgi:toxin ParE1/3/4